MYGNFIPAGTVGGLFSTAATMVEYRRFFRPSSPSATWRSKMPKRLMAGVGMPVVVSNSAVTPIKLRWVITPSSLPLTKQTTVLIDVVATKA
jgi:hypothetical protein